VLYDPDSGELLGGLYDTYGQAVTYANMIRDVLVLAIEIPGLPENEGDDWPSFNRHEKAKFCVWTFIRTVCDSPVAGRTERCESGTCAVVLAWR
jgi:hypothetical protein